MPMTELRSKLAVGDDDAEFVKEQIKAFTRTFEIFKKHRNKAAIDRKVETMSQMQGANQATTKNERRGKLATNQVIPTFDKGNQSEVVGFQDFLGKDNFSPPSSFRYSNTAVKEDIRPSIALNFAPFKNQNETIEQVESVKQLSLQKFHNTRLEVKYQFNISPTRRRSIMQHRPNDRFLVFYVRDPKAGACFLSEPSALTSPPDTATAQSLFTGRKSSASSKIPLARKSQRTPAALAQDDSALFKLRIRAQSLQQPSASKLVSPAHSRHESGRQWKSVSIRALDTVLAGTSLQDPNSGDLSQDHLDESESTPSDPAPPRPATPEQVACRAAEGRWEGIESVAAQHSYYGYWSHHPFNEPKHIGKVWSVGCPLCAVIASSSQRSNCIRHLNKHVKIVHDKVRDFQCPSCDYATGDKSDLRKHLKRCYPKNQLSKSIAQLVAEVNGSVAAEHPYCGYWSPYPFEQPQVVGQVWRVQCPLCAVVVSTARRWGSIQNLNKHVKSVHGSVAEQHPYLGYWSPYPFEEPKLIDQVWLVRCPLCAVTLSSSRRSNCIRHLNKHVKTVHDKVRDFQCPSCDYATGDKSVLLRHLKRVHYGQVPR